MSTVSSDAVVAAPAAFDRSITSSTPRTRSLQDKKLANDLVLAKTLLEKVVASAEVSTAVARRKYAPAAIAEALVLHAEAQAAYDARQLADAEAAAAKVPRDKVLEDARAEFTDYRQTVQAEYSGPARTALGASGRYPNDIEVFMTTARGAYATAKKSPYAEVLGQVEFDVERLNAALAKLDELEKLHGFYKGKDSAGTAATAARDKACDKLFAWVGKFRKHARLALKAQPALLAELAL